MWWIIAGRLQIYSENTFILHYLHLYKKSPVKLPERISFGKLSFWDDLHGKDFDREPYNKHRSWSLKLVFSGFSKSGSNILTDFIKIWYTHSFLCAHLTNPFNLLGGGGFLWYLGIRSPEEFILCKFSFFPLIWQSKRLRIFSVQLWLYSSIILVY